MAEQIERSVADTCVADVPVALAFSGGSDSLCVASSAMAAKQDLHAFSMDTGEDLASEERLVRERFFARCPIGHETLRPKGDEIREWIADELKTYDEPIGDNTLVYSAMLAQSVRAAGYKVFLTGEGGDEVFLGYPWWCRLMRWSKLIRLAPGAAALASGLVPGRHALRTVPRLMRRAAGGREAVYWDSLLGLPAELRAKLLPTVEPWAAEEMYVARLRREFLDEGGCDDGQWFTFLDLNLRLPELMLPRLDRSSMRYSTEARSPLFERDVVELALAIPERVKVPWFRPKVLYYKYLRQRVPKDLVVKKKVGYNAGMRRFLIGEPNGMSDQMMVWNRRAGVFRPDGLREVLQRVPDSVWPLYALLGWLDSGGRKGGKAEESVENKRGLAGMGSGGSALWSSHHSGPVVGGRPALG